MIADLDPHFTFLSERLKGNYADYLQYILATSTAILLIIGWLLTSKDARACIAERSWIKWPMTGVIFLFWLAEIWFSISSVLTSNRIEGLIKLLPNDGVITPGYYSSELVPVSQVVITVLAHGALYMVLFLIIWSIFSPNLAGAVTGISSKPKISD